MSTGQVLQVVGMAVSAFGYPEFGVPISMAGTAVAAAEQKFDVPKVGDLKAPQVQYGMRLPRLYGSNRTAGTLAWYSQKRNIPGDSGGKGGEPSAPTADRAEIDVLYILAIDSPIVAISRIWKNGKLVWSRHVGSDGTTLSLDASAEDWVDMRFLDGNPTQLPDPVIEASTGVGNAPAYRHRQCVLIDSLNLGQSGQLPLIEFECVTNAASDPTTSQTKLLSYFTTSLPDSQFVNPDDPDARLLNFALYGGEEGGTSIPNSGPGWDEVAVSGANCRVQDGELLLGWPDPGGLASSVSVYTTSLRMAPDGTTPITIECYARLLEFTDPYASVGHTPQDVGIISWRPNASGGGTGHGVAYEFRYNAAGQIIYIDSTPSGGDPFYQRTYISGESRGRTHLAMVFSSTSFRVYIGGLKVFERAGDHVLPFVSGAPATVQFGERSDLLSLTTLFGTEYSSADYRVDEFAVRHAETYTGDRFTPPRRIKGPENEPIITPLPIDLSDIVDAEWSRTGDRSEVVLSELEGIPVLGFQTTGSVRGALDALAAVHHFGAVCSDRVYFRKQGRNSVKTIAFADMAAGENKPADEPFVPERANDEEIPQITALTYPNYADDYANGTETGDRGFGDITSTTTISTNVVMTPDAAKKVAEVIATQVGISATTGQITLADYYADLEPTDIINVPDEDGNLYGMRITRETYGAGIRQLDLVRDGGLSAVTGSGITTTTGYTTSLTVTPPHPTSLLLIDTAILLDTDDNPGFYAFAKGSTAGATLLESPDDVTYSTDTTFTGQCVFGSCTTVLGDWDGGRVFDETSKVTVNVGNGVLSSSTFDAVLMNGLTNLCAIGVDGRWELCQFRTATMVSAGVYTLSGFLRGSRGTEWACSGHTSGESFALFSTNVRRPIRSNSEIGVAEYYKGVSSGLLPASVTPITFTDNALGKRPFAPANVRVLRDSSGNITITWDRRTRLSSRFASSLGISSPLGEATESYRAVICSGGFSTNVRTISSSIESASYSATEQTSDWGSPQPTIHVYVLQMGLSGSMYGYPAYLVG